MKQLRRIIYRKQMDQDPDERRNQQERAANNAKYDLQQLYKVIFEDNADLWDRLRMANNILDNVELDHVHDSATRILRRDILKLIDEL